MKAKNQTAFLKAGLLGFPGSGKTYTAVEIAIGLHQFCESNKPIYFLDTETGSDWAIPKFERAGIELLVAKTKAFKDLLSGIKEAEQNGFAIIIDSVSHFWNEMIESYRRSKGIKGQMQFHHWAVLKPEWHKFSNAYVNSQLHCIVCGRAGWEWGHEENDEGKKELVKLGTKMKVEGEFGFEPSLLLEMQRVKGKEVGDKIEHYCYVIKDRRMDEQSMNGKVILNPTFENFLTHVECLNIGGDHLGIDESKNSEKLFEPQGESYFEKNKRRNITLEELNGELEARYPGATKEAKIAKLGIKKHFFGTYSETALSSMEPVHLQEGLLKVLELFNSDHWEQTVNDIVLELSKNDSK